MYSELHYNKVHIHTKLSYLKKIKLRYLINFALRFL